MPGCSSYTVYTPENISSLRAVTDHRAAYSSSQGHAPSRWLVLVSRGHESSVRLREKRREFLAKITESPLSQPENEVVCVLSRSHYLHRIVKLGA